MQELTNTVMMSLHEEDGLNIQASEAKASENTSI